MGHGVFFSLSVTRSDDDCSIFDFILISIRHSVIKRILFFLNQHYMVRPLNGDSA